MSSIDIRDLDEDDVIDKIIFANERDSYNERGDLTHFICTGADDGAHERYIFIEGDAGEYVAVRRSDIGNLIKALEKAKEIWKD